MGSIGMTMIISAQVAMCKLTHGAVRALTCQRLITQLTVNKIISQVAFSSNQYLNHGY